MSLGLLSDFGVEEARRMAVDARRTVGAGKDPLDEKRARTDLGPTLGRLIDGFIESRGKSGTKDSTVRFYASLRRRVTAHEDRMARSLRQKDVALMLDGINGIPTRNRLLSLLRASFSWGMERELVFTNPAQSVRREDEEDRDRFLDDDEVKKLLAALDAYEKSGLEERARIALGIRMLLFTGQRVREVLDADLSEFRFFREEGSITAGRFLQTVNYRNYVVADWTIPKGRRKTGKAQIVPLPVPVVALIQQHHNLDIEDMLAGKCRGPLCELPGYRFDWCKRLFKDVGLSEAWTLRDLRRTCATKLADLEFNDNLIASVLGHAPTKVTGRTYVKSTRTEQRRRALEAVWDAWVPSPAHERELIDDAPDDVVL